MAIPLDSLQRPLRSLRVSVTDMCNLRCSYCMPEADYQWLPRQDVLRYEEIRTLVGAFATLGVDRVRLTGGEPLLRKALPVLVAMLADDPRLKDIALTTNGVLLKQQATALKQAGLHRVTVSVDTVHRQRFRKLTRRDDLPRVMEGLDALSEAGFTAAKIDTVVVAGFNDDELVELLELGRKHNAEVRFIEYMDVGGATRWSPKKVVSMADMLTALQGHFGPIEALKQQGSAPARRFRLEDGTTFGVVASTTTPFCQSCDRSRLTADGHWLLCLYAEKGIDLRGPLRQGAGTSELAAILRDTWQRRSDRGAEERLALRERGALLSRQDLQADPSREMHTRGG